MRRRLMITVLVTVFILAACSHNKEYIAISDEPYDLENAKVICRNATESKVRMLTQFGGLPASNTGFDIVILLLSVADSIVEEHDKPLFAECMKSKGWAEK